MSECNHDCSSCKEKCSTPESLLEKPHELSNIKKVIAVVSGKGGVGKSLVSGLLASEMAKKGKKTAVLDADVTGPSIPKMFGLSAGVDTADNGIYPKETDSGIKVMSANLLLPDEKSPVLWRGPIIAGMVKQFWTDVIWGDVDYMFVDCPPGTGDVPLTVFQSIKVDGIIVVTSPQELVSMIVAKAVNMANMMNIPILGVVENMSYVKCPDCGKKIEIFGGSKVDEVATEYNLKVLAKLPLDREIAQNVDKGQVENVNVDYLDGAIEVIESL
ncbi:MAG: Mrp/NBP35 family ATP-binding protein [Clostridia bacterium]|nr:Mrp/NBP35 family ATP-binding protein [Clostridia bacterium]